MPFRIEDRYTQGGGHYQKLVYDLPWGRGNVRYTEPFNFLRDDDDPYQAITARELVRFILEHRHKEDPPVWQIVEELFPDNPWMRQALESLAIQRLLGEG